MPFPVMRGGQLAEAVRSDKVSSSVLDRSVQRLAGQAKKTAGAEGPVGQPERAFDGDNEIIANARPPAAEGIVLLRSDNEASSLRPESSTLVVGELAVTPSVAGGGNAILNPPYVSRPLDKCVITPESPLGASRPSSVLTYATTSKLRFATPARTTRSLVRDAREGVFESTRPAEVDRAKKAEQLVVFNDLKPDWEGEGADKADIHLPRKQAERVSRPSETGTKVLLVNQSGSAVDLDFAHKIDSIVQEFCGGMECGNALADVLLGRLTRAAG